MAAKKNNKNTNTQKEALKEAALTSNGDDVVPSPLTKIADLRPGWIGDCCFRVIEESKEEEGEDDEDEKRRKQTQQHPNASSSSKQHQNSRRFREFLVGDVSGKIKFRCSEKREGESSSRLYSVISSSSLVVVVVLSFWILRRADGQTDTNRKRELIRDFESSERYFSSQLTPRCSLSLSFSFNTTSYHKSSSAEALKQNETYLLKSGKIEMIRGQMRLMTDRMTFEKSAVTPLVDEVNERRDVCEAKDCGELDLSALFFDRIQ